MFGGILGNEQLKETLIRLRVNGRVPNAMLFAGPEGVGKRLFALEIAKSFVCRTSADGLACAECPACVRAGEFEFPKSDNRDDYKKVLFSNHPDVGTVVAYNRNIFVDAIRDLENEAHFRPYEGEARTFIVDDADKMNDAASNALLKTLEEPTSTSRIVLITSRPDALLPTIRSRCQTIRFSPVETEKIERFLVNERKFSADDAVLAGRLAHGRVGSALTIELERLKPRRELLLSVLRDAIENRDRVSLLLTAEKLNNADNKDDFEANLEILVSLIRDVWTLTLGGESNVINIDLISELTGLAENAKEHRLSGWIDEIELLRESLAVNVNRKVATDALFIKMAAA